MLAVTNLAGFGMGGTGGVKAADFNTQVNIARQAGLTGAVDGKSGLLSLWLNCDDAAFDATFMTAFFGATTLNGVLSRFLLQRQNTNKFLLSAQNSAGTTRLLMTSNGSYSSVSGWVHVLASWNLGASPSDRWLYINDANDLAAGGTAVDDNLDYTLADWGIAATAGSTQQFHGCLAECFFKLNNYLDLSITANRRKFISSALKPADLGATGATPGIGVPDLYLRLREGEAASEFAKNRGSGGDCVVEGIHPENIGVCVSAP